MVNDNNNHLLLSRFYFKKPGKDKVNRISREEFDGKPDDTKVSPPVWERVIEDSNLVQFCSYSFVNSNEKGLVESSKQYSTSRTSWGNTTKPKTRS